MLIPLTFSYTEEMQLRALISTQANINFKEKDSYVQSLTVNLSYLPTDDYRQTVLNITPAEPGVVHDGYVLFQYKDLLSEKLTIGYETNIITRFIRPRVRNKIDFPLKFIDKTTSAYIQPTANIDSDNPKIAKQASQIVDGVDDYYQAVYKLADWTQQNIKYSLTTFTENATQKSSWVLENRYGVCDELTALFIGMCRSLKIPARFISGVAYTSLIPPSGGWGPHGWAEVYFPEIGWIPFDVTYNQIGYVDATHIKLKDNQDSSESSTNYGWSSYEVDIIIGSLDFYVEKLSESEASPSIISIDSHFDQKKVAPGSNNLLVVEWTNNVDYYVVEQYYLTVPNGIEVEGSKRFNIMLGPHEVKKTYHIIKTGTNFDKDYIYTIPAVIPVSPIQNATASYIVSVGHDTYDQTYFENIISNEISFDIVEQKGVSLDCWSDKHEYMINDSGTLSCNISNNGLSYLDGIIVCQKECQEIELGITQTKVVQFPLDISSQGPQSAIVTLKNDETQTNISAQYLVYEIPELQFIVSQPEISAGIDEQFNIEFNLTQTDNSPISDPKVELVYDDRNIKEFPISDFNGVQTFDLVMDTRNLFKEENEIFLTAVYKDINGNLLTTESKIVIRFDNLSLIDRIFLFFRGLHF